MAGKLARNGPSPWSDEPGQPRPIAPHAPDVSTRPGPTGLPTMRDIALAAGVSPSTVSRVLNDAPTRVPIATDTRERVQETARRLGYRPK